MVDEKYSPNDSTTETLKSTSPSMSEKDSRVETPRPISSSSDSPPQTKDENHDLKRVKSVKEAQEELNRVMTSGEGIEYPTGLRLGLISLALCLSVFLMALVWYLFVDFLRIC